MNDERISKGLEEVDRIVVRKLCNIGGSAEKEGDQLTTMGTTDVEVEGLITCYLTSMRAVRQFKRNY